MKFVFCFICAMWLSLVHSQVLVHLPCEERTLQKPIHLLLDLTLLWRAAFMLPLWTCLLCFFTQAIPLATSLNSYYSLKIQIKLFFHLTRSWIEIWTLGDFSFSLLREECISGALYRWRDHMRFTDMPSVRWWPVDKGVTESKTDKWQHEIMNDTCCPWLLDTCPEVCAGLTALPQ